MPEETPKSTPAEDPQKDKPARSGCLLKCLTTALILLVVLVIVFFVRDRMVQSRAEEMLREAEQALADIEVPQIAAGENGEELYKQASAGIVGEPTLPGKLQAQLEEGALTIDSAEITKLLADNKGCLALAMQGYRKPKCVYTTDYSKGYAAPIPNLLRTRAVALMLVMSARRAAAEGRGKEAAERLGAVLRLSRGVSRMRILISHMIGLACEAIAVEAVRDILIDGKGDETFLAEMSGILAAHEQKRPKLIESLKVERAGSMLGAAQITALEFPPGAEKLGPNPLALRFLRWWGIPFRDAEVSKELWTRTLEMAAKPYPQVYDELVAFEEDPAVVEKVKKMKFPYDFTVIHPHKCARADAESLALLRAARTAVALCRGKLKDGKYPESAPASMPADPFSGKPLIYRRTDSGFVIYSVGGNKHKDDGGKNMFGAHREPDVVFAVDAAARKAFQDAERKKAEQRKKRRGVPKR
jgi:hypothetical protein